MPVNCVYLFLYVMHIHQTETGSRPTSVIIFQVSDAVHLLQGGNARYDSPHIFNEMLSCISTVLAASVKEYIKRSPFIGIGGDELTDMGCKKHLAIVVRYVTEDYALKTTFLVCMKVSWPDLTWRYLSHRLTHLIPVA